jgi:tRNA A37 threonylcarbamoyladenosine dehydratase
MDPKKTNRYFKQMLLSEIGEHGQRRLSESRVLIVGCGAPGTVIVNSIVRSGVGRVKIVDRDFIELDDLPRQSGDVSYNDYMLKFKIPPYELTVFSDARVIIKWTSDEISAKNIYAKYIGL